MSNLPLTGPGGPFEIVDEDVLGERMRVYQDARALAARAARRARTRTATKEYIVHGDAARSPTRSTSRASRRSARVLRDEYGVGRATASRSSPRTAPSGSIAFWATRERSAASSRR